MKDFNFGEIPNEDFIEENEVIERPLLIVRDAVLFPRILTPVAVLRESSLEAIEAANDDDEELIIVTQHDPELDRPTPNDVYRMGVRASIVRYLRAPTGTANVLLQGLERVEILDWLQTDPYPVVRGRMLFEEDELPTRDLSVEAQRRAILALFERYTKLHSHMPDDAFAAAENIKHPGWLADFVAAVLEISLEQRQEILDIVNPLSRLQRLSIILARELDVLELEDRIHNQVQQSVDKSQREFFLREQIKVIQNELGEAGGGFNEIGDLQERLEQLELPDEVRDKAENELARLAEMPPLAPEVGIIRTYLDWLMDLPWYEASPDNLDIDHAEVTLDQNHYGLPRVKERILEYMAVRARTAGTNKLRTPILCFVGPPGTGKTSLGQSIAEALGRQFARLSLGGIRDEAEIRGHRRTYIGAMPGRIIQTMKRVGTVNPLIMLDEIDKVGLDYRGDPTAALLEALDPEQNHSFSDHYLNLPYDLSRVLFITTANVMDTVPPALADRMEVIEFAGYIDQEKRAIARQFLIPRHREEHNLSADELIFTDQAIQTIIRAYTHESGVRNLDREIGRVCRKVVRRMMQGKRTTRRITPRTLATYLGPPRYQDTRLNRSDEVGLATGLSWTSAGGEVLLIEVSLYPGTGKLTLTGQLGDVMQESVQAALSYTKANAKTYGIDPQIFEKQDVHLHVPEGAIRKDGPSAGVTMVTALVSAFSGRPVRHQVAMTGEVTLRGRVLPVGGLKVKIIAAHRAGMKTIIIPAQNERDLVEIPRQIRQNLDIILAESMTTVLDVALL